MLHAVEVLCNDYMPSCVIEKQHMSEFWKVRALNNISVGFAIGINIRAKQFAQWLQVTKQEPILHV